MPQQAVQATAAKAPFAQRDLRHSGELYLAGGGIQKSTLLHPYEREKENMFYLHFVLEGSGVAKTEKTHFQLEKGDIFLQYAEDRVLYRAGKENPWKYAWLTFGGEKVETYLQYAGFSREDPVQHSSIPIETYLAPVEEVMQERGVHLADEMARAGLLYQLLSMLVEAQHRDSRRGKSGHDYSREIYVEHAKEYVLYNYAHICINDIANHVGVNRSYLTRIFKETLGLSPQEYLLRFRLEKGAEMLKTTDWTLRVIAQRIGYEDPFTFSKIFKSRYQTSPSVFRNLYLHQQMQESLIDTNFK